MVSNAGTEISSPPGTEESSPLADTSSSEAQFLQLYLEVDYPILLPVHHLMEIITMPMGHIVPMFQMPAWVVGVYNWRGEVLWIVDLNHFLGLKPWYQRKGYAAKHTVVILKGYGQEDKFTTGSEVALGVVVDRIETMLTCHSDDINACSDLPFELSPSLTPFIQRYWQNDAQIPHLILEAPAIIETMPRA